MEVNAREAALVEGGRATALEALLATLDAALVLCTGILVVYLTVGGINLGLVTVHRFSKPALILLVLGSLRGALPGASWLTRLIGRLRLDALVPAAVRRSTTATSALDAMTAFVTVHVVARLGAFYANLLLASGQGRMRGPFAAAKLMETFGAWDSGWYLAIARFGYSWDPTRQSSIAFFPLYPLVIRALAWPFGGSERAFWLAAILVSHASFFLGLLVLHRLCWQWFGDREAARRAVLYVAVFPFAYFFTEVYTEALFLLLSVGAIGAAVSRRWTLAGVLGFLCALSRPNGVLLAVPLALLAIEGRPRVGTLVRRLAAVCLVPAGLATYSAFAYRLSGDPLAWLHAQAHWGYSVGNPPWLELMRMLDALATRGIYGYLLSEPLTPYYLVHGIVALLFVALLPSVCVRLGAPLGAYVALSLYLPLSGNALEGIGRYCATLFPVFMFLGASTSKRAHEAILVIGGLLLSLFAGLFVTGHPMY